jgi:PAS domain S-box-containing protein
MVDNSPSPSRSELSRLRARVSELEEALARATSAPQGDPDGAERYRRLLEGVPAVPWEGSPSDFTFTYVGPQAEAFLGFPQGDWCVPGFWVSRLHPEDRDAAVRRCKEAMVHGRDHTFEYRLLAADGRVVWVLDVVRLVCAGGKPVLAYGVLLDVSDRKKAEEERRRLEEKMRQAQKMESLGVLAGGIAHDFNNLLTSVLGYTELAECDLPPGAPARAYLREVSAAGRRAAELTQQILFYAGKARCVFQPVNLSELIQGMDRLLATVVPHKAELRLECPLSVPPIKGDPAQLRQVVLNLITNAAEALGDRPGVITVRTGTRQLEQPAAYSPHAAADLEPGAYACLEVADTGCGMTQETCERIFDPFFTTKFPGRGLGLAAGLGIVRSHRGLLRVTSAIERGSTFEVLLPALPGEDAPVPTPVRPKLHSGTVLVVEDEEGVRSLATRILGEEGYCIVEARDGQEGVRRFEQQADGIDVVLLDLTMPRLDGLEVLARVRAVKPEVPVVLMTGYSTEELSGTLREDLAVLLQKPFTSEELLAAVGAARAKA